MKAEELRIGNLILTPKDKGGKPFLRSIIEEIKADSVIVDGQRQVMIEDCGGIPLTEDWLKGFGYEKEGSINFVIKWNAREIHIILHKNSNTFTFPYHTNGLMSIHFVHQLQNLYFALTGSELTITQPA